MAFDWIALERTHRYALERIHPEPLMPDPRTTTGELMCPVLYPADRVDGLKRELLRDYAAQFQQQPVTDTGAHFHRAWLPVRSVRPAGDPVSRCRFWDLASTKQTPGKDPDWTAGALVSRWPDGLYSVDDVVKLRDTPGVVDKTILGGDSAGRPWRAREDRAADRDRRRVPGFGLHRSCSRATTTPVASRPERSRRGGGDCPFRPRAATSGWPRAPGMMSLCANSATLPGRHDDQADAAAGAFNEIAISYSAHMVPIVGF